MFLNMFIKHQILFKPLYHTYKSFYEADNIQPYSRKLPIFNNECYFEVNCSITIKLTSIEYQTYPP